jgi:hypothetical protein
VAVFYWLVPVWSDRCCGTLVLMRSGQIRSTDTPSLSDLILCVETESDGSGWFWRRSSPRVRSPATGGEVAALGVDDGLLRWSLALEKSWTVRGSTGRVHLRGQHRRLLAE